MSDLLLGFYSRRWERLRLKPFALLLLPWLHLSMMYTRPLAVACCIGTPRFSSVRSGPPDGHTLFLLESKYMAGSQPEPDKALIRTVQVEVGGAQDPGNPRYCAGYS